MPIGLSIHIGVNEVDARHYGTTCRLRSCEGDAHAMRELAVNAGFEPLATLLGPAATTQAVLDAVRGAAPRIGTDGLLLLTYAGHGAQVRAWGSDGRRSVWNETWCTHDRQLVDTELQHCWGDFMKGARILVVSDSCFSGDIIRGHHPVGEPRDRKEPDGGSSQADVPSAAPADGVAAVSSSNEAGGVSALRKSAEMPAAHLDARFLTSRAAHQIYNRHQALYDQIQREVYARSPCSIEAQVLLLAASQDNEPAQDGHHNGAFTAALLEAWNGGAFDGSYVTLYEAIRKRLVPRQHPAILAIRPPAFAHQRPFTI